MTTQAQLDSLRALIAPLTAGSVTQAQISALTAAVAGLSPDPVVSTGRRINVSWQGTNFDFADQDCAARWQVAGGCYADANGVENGPTPTIKHVLTADLTQTIDVSGIDGDLFIRCPTLSAPWGKVMALDNVEVGLNGFWIAKGSPPQQRPVRYGDPCLVVNAGRAKVLTFSLGSPADAGKVMLIDRVQGPLVASNPVTPVPWKGGNVVGVTGKVLDIAMTSRDNIKSYMRPSGDFQPGDTPGSIAYGEQYLTESTGMPFIRFTTSPPVAGKYNTRLISWFFHFAQTRPEVWAGFGIRLGKDVATGMNEAGCKLCGFGVDVANRTVSFTAEHDRVSSRNLGLYGLEDYLYDAQGAQQMYSMNATLQEAKWYWIEMHAKMNSAPGVADGIEEMWLDGTLVYSNRAKLILSVAGDAWGQWHGQYYHGGTTSPKGPMTIDMAHYAVRDDGRVGVPPEILPLL